MRRKQSPIAKLQHIVEHDAKAIQGIEHGAIFRYLTQEEAEELEASGFLTLLDTWDSVEINRSLLASTEVVEDPIDKEALKESIKEVLFKSLPNSVPRWAEGWDQLIDDIVQVFYVQDPLEASHRERLSRMLYGHGTALWEDIFVQIDQLIEDRDSGK